MIDLVGPKGYVHNWVFVGVPGAKAAAPKASGPAAAKASGSLLDAYKGWRDSLTPAESKAMSFYQSPGFALMNGQLRGVDGGHLKASEHATDADLARARQASKGLAGAIAKAPPLPRDTTVYRGFDAGQFGDLTPGKVITDKGFTSVSVNNDAGAVGRATSKAQAVITLPAGTRAAAGSVRELVLPPGSSFRVVSAQKRGKVTHVRLELVPRGGKKLANRRGRALELTGPKGWSHGWIRDGDTVTYTGNLGVGRADMAQLSGTVAGKYVPSAAMIPKFIAHLRGKGITVTSRRAPAESLRATQTTGSMPMIRGIADDLKSGRLADTKPIVISSDNRVLDGHHTWAGRVLADSEGGRPDLPPGMRVVQVGMPMADLIGEARQFGRASGIAQRKPGEIGNPAFMKPKVGLAARGVA
jgi:hypothetical protein